MRPGERAWVVCIYSAETGEVREFHPEKAGAFPVRRAPVLPLVIEVVIEEHLVSGTGGVKVEVGGAEQDGGGLRAHELAHPAQIRRRNRLGADHLDERMLGIRVRDDDVGMDLLAVLENDAGDATIAHEDASHRAVQK